MAKMFEYFMLQIIIRLSMHYIKKGKHIEKYSIIAGAALDIALRNETWRLYD